MLRRLIALVIATIGMSCGGLALAAAADMPVKAPPPVPAPSWTGFYLGAGIGMRSVLADPTVTSEVFTQAGNPLSPANDLLDCGTPPCINGAALNSTSPRGSIYLGYNFQIAPRWVLGAEGDFGFANQSAAFTGAPYPASFVSGTTADQFAVKTTWDASVRGRVGFLVDPSLMFYVTAGPSWIDLQTTSSCSGVAPSDCAGSLGRNNMMPFVISHDTARLGWTLGGGIEKTLWGNWFIRGEYRYADYGTFSASDLRSCSAPCGFGLNAPVAAAEATSYDIHLRIHTALLGLAYKFGDPVGLPPDSGYPVLPALFTKAPPVAAVASWTGPYLGMSVGLRSAVSNARFAGGSGTSIFGTGPLTVCATATCVTSEPFNSTAFRFAPYLGFNWQIAPKWVVGVEGDWGVADRTITLTGMDYPETTFMSGNAADTLAVRTTWDASVRGRIGLLVTPSLLAYVTGGAAWQHIEATSTCTTTFETCGIGFFGTGFSPNAITHSADKVGPTVGVGIEARVWRNWLARAEYRYTDFGTMSNTDFRSCATCVFGAPASETVSYNVSMQTHTVLFGLAYEFGDYLAAEH